MVNGFNYLGHYDYMWAQRGSVVTYPCACKRCGFECEISYSIEQKTNHYNLEVLMCPVCCAPMREVYPENYISARD